MRLVGKQARDTDWLVTLTGCIGLIFSAEPIFHSLHSTLSFNVLGFGFYLSSGVAKMTPDVSFTQFYFCYINIASLNIDMFTRTGNPSEFCETGILCFYAQ